MTKVVGTVVGWLLIPAGALVWQTAPIAGIEDGPQVSLILLGLGSALVGPGWWIVRRSRRKD